MERDKILGNDLYQIKNGVNGFICRPEKEDFMNAIQDFVDQPEILKTHAEINRHIVKPLGATGTAELYHKLINKFR